MQCEILIVEFKVYISLIHSVCSSCVNFFQLGLRSLEPQIESITPCSCQETSEPVLLLIEDNTEDFKSELTLYNDLRDTSDLVSCHEYLPYYRTYATLLENPLSINTENETTEDVQSNGYVFKSEYEDKPINNIGFDSGYVPYYRSYEEYFTSPALPSEVPSKAETEKAETNGI